MVEDVHRLGGPNLQLEVVAAARVVDANPEAVGVGLPEQHDLERAGQPLGQFSSSRIHGFAPGAPGPSRSATVRGPRFPLVSLGRTRRGQACAVRRQPPRSIFLPAGESASQPAPNACEPSPFVWPGFVSSRNR